MNLMNLMTNLMNLMMILCNCTYTAPELTLPSSYHLNTPVRNMSSAHLQVMLLARFVVRKALNNMEGRWGSTYCKKRY